jgi:heme A synthase
MLKHSHSGFRWIVIVILIAAVVFAFLSWKQKKNYSKKDKIIHLVTLILVHLQLLIGLTLYFIGWGTKVDFAQMGDSMIRFYTIEHSLMMILAITAITIGYSKSKKISDSALRFKTIFISYLIGLLLILIAIPWPFRAALGAGWM